MRLGLLLPSHLCLVLELGLLSSYLSGALSCTFLGDAACFGGVSNVIAALLLWTHAASS